MSQERSCWAHPQMTSTISWGSRRESGGSRAKTCDKVEGWVQNSHLVMRCHRGHGVSPYLLKRVNLLLFLAMTNSIRFDGDVEGTTRKTGKRLDLWGYLGEGGEWSNPRAKLEQCPKLFFGPTPEFLLPALLTSFMNAPYAQIKR